MSEPLAQQESDSSPGPSINIEVLKGGLVATLTVSGEINNFPSLKQLHLAIENAGVAHGIDDQALEKLVKQKTKGKPLVIARGTAPVAGEAARLIWNATQSGNNQAADVIDTQSGQSLRNHYFSRVRKGAQILSKLPPTGGTEGVNVHGSSISVAGKDIALPQGEGTQPSKDGLSLIASVDGIASWSGESVRVTPVTEIKGSVDSKTGDIDVEGTLHIGKDVRTGFKVEAVGDIFVEGNIEGADVYSRSGSVMVRNGILGQSKARVLAGHNIIAGFIQDATIGAKHDVEVERYIINSAVTAGRYIMAVTNEGIVRGALLFAEKKIEARVVGSDSRIETDLKVGYMPPENVSRTRYLLHNDQRRNRMELAYVQKRLAFLQLLKERMGSLTDEKELQLAELVKKEKLLLHEHRSQAEKEDDLLETEETEMIIAPEVESIRIHETIYPDVKVAIGDVAIEMSKERNNVMFFRVGDRLSFGPLHQVLRSDKTVDK